MPADDDGITEPENSNATLAKIFGDALTRDWGRRPPESASPEDEDALPGAVPREPGEGGRVGNDIETTPAEPDEDFDAVMEAVLQSIGDIDLEAQWRAFHADVTGAIHAETVEAIRSGFLRALEDGTVTLPAGAADALKTKNELPRVEAALEYRADSGDLPEPTIVVGDAADGALAPSPGVPESPDESVLDLIDAEPERPASSIFGAIDRELAAEAAAEQAASRARPRVPIWIWPAVAAAVIAVGAFLALGGGDDEPDAAAAGGGTGLSPVATTVPLAEASAAPTAVPTAASAAPIAKIPTLVICPGGSSFSGYEQPDGSYLDAETGETHVCPPPPN